MCLFDVGLHPNNSEVISAAQKVAHTTDDEDKAKRRFVANKMRNQFDVVIDQANEHKMAEILAKTPLATVKAGPQSGNFLCHLDCNHYGGVTHAPSIRKVPMGKDALRKLCKPVIIARYGQRMADDVPEHLAVGDLFHNA